MKRSMFEAMMDTTQDSIVFADLGGRYIEVSQKKADNWGKTRQEMRGLTDSDLMDPEEAQQAREDSLRVINTGEPITNCRRKAIRHGEVVWYSLSEQPWLDDDGKMIGTISITRDITEFIEQEQRTFAMSRQILDMVKIVSHDLNSPLINISAIAKMIMRRTYGETNEGVCGAANEIYRRILKLRGAVLDYLHKFSNLCEGQEFEKEEVDLRKDVIDEVLEELEECIRDNESTVDSTLGLIPTGAIVLCTNKELLKIVYRNHITNALKHGGMGCVISFGYEDWQDKFALNVYNNGPAVPEEEIPFLFEPFIQGKNVCKGNGIGIGLHTIRNMVRNLGGDMWYKTTLSGNPNFIFTIKK